jgi:Tol biopolymer transport system component
MRNRLALASALLLVTAGLAAQQPASPTIDQVISLKRPGAVALSPDGSRVAFTVNETNWDENAYETEIFLASASGGAPVQLTRAKKSSSSPAWSPDGKWLAFISDRTDKRQLYLISPEGGEAQAITNADEGVTAFRWSPDGKRMALTMTEPQSEAMKEREKKYGAFEVIDQEYRMAHLYLIDVDPAASPVAKPKQLTKGAFTVGGFSWSPDGRSIAFDHRIDPNLENSHTADISVVNVADGGVRKLVTTDGPDSGPVWSPDGTQIAFGSAMANPSFFYTNNRIAIVPAAGGTPKSVSDAFDEQPGIIDWSPAGILFSGLERASSRLYRLDTGTGRITPLTPASGASVGGISFSRDFSTMAYTSGDAKAFPEVFVAPVATPASARKLTSFADQINGWSVGSREMI